MDIAKIVFGGIIGSVLIVFGALAFISQSPHPTSIGMSKWEISARLFMYGIMSWGIGIMLDWVLSKIGEWITHPGDT